MNDNKPIVFTKKDLTNNPAQDVSTTRAKSFKIKTSIRDYAQYANTIKAYAQAGMPFEHIANAGEQLGDIVEKGELDASLALGWQGKAGEIAEDEGRIIAWQSRGEKVPLNNQLSSAPTGSSELITISNTLTTVGLKSEKTIEVVEGINVTNQQSAALVSAPSSDSQLENNPYLKNIPDLKSET